MAKDLIPFMVRFLCGVSLTLSLELSQDYPFLLLPIVCVGIYLVARWVLAYVALRSAVQSKQGGEVLATALNESWLMVGWGAVYVLALVVWGLANV